MNNALDVLRVQIAGASGLGNCSHPKIATDRSLVHCDNDIVTLAHADVEDFSLIRFNGHKVVRNDSHGMVVNHELEMRFNGAADDPEAIGLLRNDVDGEP